MSVKIHGDSLAGKVRLLRKDFAHVPTGRDLRGVGTVRVKPFDVEETFAAAAATEKRNRRRKYRGPDSPLYSAIYPLVCVAKAFALAPYDFTADRLTPSNVGLLFTAALAGIYCRIMYVVYLRFASLKRQKLVLDVVETTKVVVNYLVLIYELVSTVFRRGAFCKVWNGLQDFDDRLNALGYPRNENRTEAAAWTLLISQIIAWTLANQSGMYAFGETWLFNVSYMLTYVGTAISVYKFFGMACFFAQRFRQLNRIAELNLPARRGYRSSSVSRKTVQELHNDLLLSAEGLASVYSWSLLFWLGNLSVHSVANLFFIIDWTLIAPWSNISWKLVLNMICWLGQFIAQLLALHIACDYATNEANSMGAIIVEWDARIVEKFPRDNTIMTTLHFLNRRLRFTAGGLFDVNLPLFRSIVGLMSTYLILLLQLPN